MLHELLLALSGHTSPLLSDDKDVQHLGQLLSPSEDALLRSVARLGNLHIEVRTDAATVVRTHPSVLCRAVARAIETIHLAKFQEHIVDVERNILKEDASLVGAYDIVPLSGIVASFSEWKPKMEWLKRLLQLIQTGSLSTAKHTVNGHDINSEDGLTSGAQLINWLRKEMQTGYPSIEHIATSLNKVAERTWLRQVSAWVLYGRLPERGTKDFLIQQADSSSSHEANIYRLKMDLSPSFVTPDTAKSILFIGKSLNYVRNREPKVSELQNSSSMVSNASLLPEHLKRLSSVDHPISSAGLNEAIGAVRSSLSHNVLQKVLPKAEILKILNLLHHFFLLGRGDFAVALIAAADECLCARQRQNLNESIKAAHRFGGVMIKEGEVTAVITRTWTNLATLHIDHEDYIDDELDLARDMVRLSIKKHTVSEASNSFQTSSSPLSIIRDVKTTFGDIILATPVSLTIDVTPPLDLFLSSAEVDVYSTIHAYLLSIRRAHLHLTDLWKLSVLRRIHPSPAQQLLKQRKRPQTREYVDSYSRNLRSTWAMISSTAFLFAELGEYLQGEIVTSSWSTFSRWLNAPERGDTLRPTSSRSMCGSLAMNESAQPDGHNNSLDPETLTNAHQSYLNALTHALLLDDLVFTKSVKALLTKLDYVAALVKRLSAVQFNVDMMDSGISEGTLATEENEIMDNLVEVRHEVEKDVQNLVKRLGDIDIERLGVGIDSTTDGSAGFVPSKGGSLHRLLMKLDFARPQMADVDLLRDV